MSQCVIFNNQDFILLIGLPMTERIREINRKLARSNQDLDRIIRPILSQESPLLQPQKQLLRAKSQNPEQEFNTCRTLTNQLSLKMPVIQQPHLNLEKTHKKFYTPQKKQKYSHIKINPPKTKFSFDTGIDEHAFCIAQKEATDQTKLHEGQPRRMQNSKICEIDHEVVLKHVNSHTKLTSSTKPQLIFDYFYEFVPFIRKPLIKKFKNCLFFGDPIASNQYQGFLYFYNNKVYYGDFQDEHKHGSGVEINLNTNTVYKGRFERGHKIGKFTVYRDEQRYEGYLNKGKYHGQGKLSTKISVYTGSFYLGERHGKGEQYFFKSGLKLVGVFNQNKFSNQNPDSPALTNISGVQPRLRNHKKLPKISNVRQFSYRQASESEDLEDRVNLRHLLNNETIFDMYKDEQEQDGPLPSPFKRFSLLYQ